MLSVSGESGLGESSFPRKRESMLSVSGQSGLGESSFPRKRGSMLSVSECYDSWKLVGSRWIPAFAGMTSPVAFAGMTSPVAFAGMTMLVYPIAVTHASH